ncbi:MAG: hypothetical protein K2W33_20110, partial [Burkholderiales bacterium]|nr:hypothetical protein [Burkholderiales bacterium]
MKFTFKKAVVVAGMVLSSTLAMAQFAANMSYDAIAAEVKARKDKGESAEAIANAAKAVLGAGQAGSLVTAMLSQNLDGAAVVQSV